MQAMLGGNTVCNTLFIRIISCVYYHNYAGSFEVKRHRKHQVVQFWCLVSHIHDHHPFSLI